MAEKAIQQKTKYVKPRYAVHEAENGQLNVRVEMPGVGKEDLDIKVENNELRILGQREPEKDEHYLLRERSHGDFLQAFTLDQTVDQGRVDAVLEKGILMIRLDLKEPVKPRTIKIRSE
ncbi:MAG TPA: Hsp20/alpha crystallin family protein [Spirochaetia bacterium]|nr:Hsp20/alpha crystallin family protein [Spirochaetia bacterium]